MINLLGRRSFVVMASTLILGLVGYSQFRSRAGSSSSGDEGSAPIRIETSSLFITVENHSGQSLTDARASIVPVGRATVFNAFVGRLEPGERRDLSVGNFTSRDGTPFNRRVVRPKSIIVTASDIHGKPYRVETDWR